MIRGTTPTICFKLPFDDGQIAELWLTISQRGQEVLTKEKPDMTYDGEKYSIKLTQEDTLKLDDDQYAEIQLRIRTASGDAIASRVKRIAVEEILKDGVI